MWCFLDRAFPDHWRRLVVEGALTAAGSGEQVVPASDYRALQSQVRELQRLLGKKTKLRTIGFLGPNAHSAANEWVAALAQRLCDVET